MPDEADDPKPKKARAGRSPSYPSLTVREAIDKAKALQSSEGDYAAPLSSALKAWGYSHKSSAGRQTLATMKYYGLIDIAGDGDARKIKVSDIARRIILDNREDETDKRQLIRKVALAPAAHKTLFEEYPGGLASDGTVNYFLVHEQGFNPEAANELIAEFKDTSSYIGLYQSQDTLDKPPENSVRDGDVDRPTIRVGDKVQVTVGGVDTFSGGALVLGFSEDGAWVFTDQSNSGVKLEEVTLIEAAMSAPPVEPPNVPKYLLKAKEDEEPARGSRRAVFPLDEGDVSLVFPEGLSAEGLEELGQYLSIFLKKEAKKAKAD